MNFEWDPHKAEANRRKHGIDFADAVGVFEDVFALTQLVLVSWLWRGENIRLLSARKATPRESRQYTEGLDDA